MVSAVFTVLAEPMVAEQAQIKEIKRSDSGQDNTAEKTE